MSQTTRIAASVQIVKQTAPDGGDAKATQIASFLADLATGTGSGQADVGFVDTDRALASNTSEDFDVANSLTDALGVSVVCAKVKAIMIKAADANTTDLTIGGASAELLAFFAATGDKLILKPGDCLLAYSKAGWAVAAGTADDLKIANATGATAHFDIAIVGTSA